MNRQADHQLAHSICAAPERSGVARAVAAALLLAAAGAIAQPSPSNCGELTNGFGPYDYRTERGNNLNLVEIAHFTPAVEALIRGNTASHPGQDLDYTLRAFPNHHRALVSMSRLAERGRKPQPANMRYTADCWFERAIRFRPEDATARMLFAGYLIRTERKEMASQQLEQVRNRASDNGFTHYNLGLMYLELKDFDRALEQAHRADELGFTLPALPERLKAAGKWADRPARAASAAPAASEPATAANAAAAASAAARP